MRRQKPTLPEDDVLEMCKKAFDSVLEGDEPWKATESLILFTNNNVLSREEQLEIQKYTNEKIKAYQRNLLKVECMKKLMGEGRRLAEIGQLVDSLGGSEVKITGAGMPNPFANMNQQSIQNAFKQRMIDMQAQQDNQMMSDLNRMGSGYGLSPQQLDGIAGLGGMK